MKNYQNDKIVVDTPRGKIIVRKYTKGASKGTVYARVEWAPGYGPDFAASLTSARAKLTHRVALRMDPYVPFQTGALKNSAMLASDFDSGEIVHATPYARRQYYLHPMGTDLRGATGKRGSYWGVRCLADNRDAITKEAKALVQMEAQKK